MRAKKHGDQAHSWPTFCYELSRIFLTAPPAYDPVTFHRGRCEKCWRDGKLATSSYDASCWLIWHVIAQKGR